MYSAIIEIAALSCGAYLLESMGPSAATSFLQRESAGPNTDNSDWGTAP
jgi:hypothetical protein